MQKKVDVIFRRIKPNFERKGYINLNHIQINSKEKLAEIAQIFRDPRYETFRMIYMKDNKIVGQEAVTSKIPGCTRVFTGNKVGITRAEQGTYKIKERMKRLKADGYYMVHNHPTGRAKASQKDVDLSHFFYEKIEGYKGHLIINSNSYAWIDIEGEDVYVTNEIPIRGKGKSIQRKVEQKGIFDICIRTRKDLVHLMNNIKNREDYSIAIVVDKANIPRMVLDIPNKFLNMKNEQIRRYFQNIGRENGGSYVFFATQDRNTWNRTLELIEQGTFRDSILYGVMNKELILCENPEFDENLYKRIDLFSEYDKKDAIRVCEREEKYMEENIENENLEKTTTEEKIEKEEFLKILYKAVGKMPRVMKIENTLEAKQELVGGLIEAIPYKDAILICNEEGKILNQEPNLVFDFDYVAGDCFAVGDDYENGEFKSLTDEQIEEFREDFIKRAMFTKSTQKKEEKKRFERI